VRWSIHILLLCSFVLLGSGTAGQLHRSQHAAAHAHDVDADGGATGVSLEPLHAGGAPCVACALLAMPVAPPRVDEPARAATPTVVVATTAAGSHTYDRWHARVQADRGPPVVVAHPCRFI
jgi:hypothetical protein